MWCRPPVPRAARARDAWLCHVSSVGGAGRRGCAAAGAPESFWGLLTRAAAGADLEPHVGGAFAHAPLDRDLIDEMQAPPALDGRLRGHLDLRQLSIALVDDLARD